MKKLFFLFLIFISCSKEENPAEQGIENTEEDPIIGTWQPIKRMFYYNDHSESELVFSECQRRGRLIFKENGETSPTGYILEEEECVIMESSAIKEEWVRMAEEKYRFAVTYYDHNEEIVTDYSYPERIWFPEKGVMIISHEPEANIKNYFTEYKRM